MDYTNKNLKIKYDLNQKSRHQQNKDKSKVRTQ